MNTIVVLAVLAVVVVAHASPLGAGTGLSLDSKGLNLDTGLNVLGLGTKVNANVGLSGAHVGLDAKAGDKQLVDANVGAGADGLKVNANVGDSKVGL